MCVICTAAKKRHMKREEVVEAITSNPAGFFGYTVHDGKRRTVRTLDSKEFLRFFDSVDADDVWAMHARVPSRGEKSLDNVHGWEEDGILFCHNMTLTDLDDMTKRAGWEGTDSEFFFRHVFMPFYRGCGEDAYRDGKFCQDLDNLVTHFCGASNKFLFIMPDGRMLRYGHWVTEEDRKEDGEPAFYASNTSYRRYTPSWPAAAPGQGWRQSAVRSGYYTDPLGSARYACYDDRVDDAIEAVRAAGFDRLGEAAIRTLVAHGAMAERCTCDAGSPCAGDTDLSDAVRAAMRATIPKAFTEDVNDAVVEGLAGIAEAIKSKGGDYAPVAVARFLNGFADELAPALLKACPTEGPLDIPDAGWAEIAFSEADLAWHAFSIASGVMVDLDAARIEHVASSVRLELDARGRPKAVKSKAVDLLVPSCLEADDAFRAVSAILDYMKVCEETAGAGEAADTGCERYLG